MNWQVFKGHASPTRGRDQNEGKSSETELSLSLFIRRVLWILICTYVLGPSGSVIILYASGSGSFLYQQAKTVRKTLISTIFWLVFDYLSMTVDVNVPSKCTVISKKKTLKKKLIFLGILLATKYCTLLYSVRYKFQTQKTGKGG